GADSHAGDVSAMPSGPSGAIQERQTFAGLGGDESDADDSLAAHGHDGRPEGLRRLSQDWSEISGGNCRIASARIKLWDGVVRCLPHAAHILGGRSAAAASVRDVSHGFGSSAV